MKFITNSAEVAPLPLPLPLPLSVDPASRVPLVVQISQQLTWLIATRRLESGQKLPATRALAAQLGVHFHTVRAAYHQLDTDGLVSLRHGSGAVVLPFSSLQLARPTSNLPTYTIGVLIAGLDPFYLPFIRGIEQVSLGIPALTFICNTEDSPIKARLQIDQLIARGVDGLIAASVGRVVKDEFDPPASRPSLPVVYCDQPDLAGHSFVFDGEQAGYLAVAHLVEHGHRRIGLISAPLDWPNMQELYHGFRRALLAAGLREEPGDVSLVAGFTLAEGERAARALWARPDPPGAIFATADILAMGALRALRGMGWRVPQDAAVVGYTDIELAGLVEPPLTSVAVPVEEMGRRAMQTLARLLAGERVEPGAVRLPTRLVTRRSCGCPGQAP